jgi:hypothetical protein
MRLHYFLRTGKGALPSPARCALVLGSALLLLLPGAGLLQAQDGGGGSSDTRLRTSLQINALLFDNFFQAPAGRPDTTVRAAAVRFGVAETVARRIGGEVFADGRLTIFERFEPSYGAGGGIRFRGRGQRLEAGVGYDWWLPRLDVADTVGRADVGTVQAAYAVRMGRVLELSAEGTGRLERFIREGEPGVSAPVVDRDHTFVELGGAARTRIFGRLFSPEVGYARGSPRGLEPELTYVQRQRYVQVRSLSATNVYLSVRYRRRDRAYPLAPPDSRNHDRLDRREQLAVTADLAMNPHFSWVVYYAYEDATSNMPARNFTTHLISLGVRAHSR